MFPLVRLHRTLHSRSKVLGWERGQAPPQQAVRMHTYVVVMSYGCMIEHSFTAAITCARSHASAGLTQ